MVTVKHHTYILGLISLDSTNKYGSFHVSIPLAVKCKITPKSRSKLFLSPTPIKSQQTNCNEKLET